MLDLEYGFIDMNNRMTDAMNNNTDEYLELCHAYNECKCLASDIDKYMYDIKRNLDLYEKSDIVSEDEEMSTRYLREALVGKQMIKYCLKELANYGFKVKGEPEYDERLTKYIHKGE